jgi:signal transduction histidine kinase
LANELTLILANARRHLTNPEFQRDLLLSMEDSVRSMQRLLDKVAQRRKDEPASKPVDFEALVKNALRARGTGATRLEYARRGAEPLPITCDGERLASMSGHLIQNAIEAAGASGHVTVRLGRNGDDVVLEVEDDGPGMAPDVLRDRLRHPFQSSKPGGFGLGLFECRQLSQELGGELVVTSAVGRGTLARLRLPLAKGPESAGEDGPHAVA